MAAMKLYSSALSPYARKVRIVIQEKGLDAQVEILTSNPYEATDDHLRANPLSKVPTLVLADGTSLFDSNVICEYLDGLSGGSLIPQGQDRITALRQLALTDGLLDSTFNIACELHRRESHEQSARWVDRWFQSLERGVDELANSITSYSTPLNLSHIGAVCALDYLDLRAADRLSWRERQPALKAFYSEFGEGAAMQTTRPEA